MLTNDVIHNRFFFVRIDDAALHKCTDIVEIMLHHIHLRPTPAIYCRLLWVPFEKRFHWKFSDSSEDGWSRWAIQSWMLIFVPLRQHEGRFLLHHSSSPPFLAKSHFSNFSRSSFWWWKSLPFLTVLGNKKVYWTLQYDEEVEYRIIRLSGLDNSGRMKFPWVFVLKNAKRQRSVDFSKSNSVNSWNNREY